MTPRQKGGAAALAVGLLAFLVLFSLFPVPEHPATFTRRELDPEYVASEGGQIPDRSHPAEGVRFLVSGATATHYDMDLDVTWAQFGSCNHQPCGVALRFDGDARERLKNGPLILEPRTEDEVRLERLEPDPFEQPRGVEGTTMALSVAFETRPLGAEPYLLAAAGAIVLGGIAMLIPSVRIAYAVGIGALGGVVVGTAISRLHMITVWMGIVLFGIVGIVGAAAVVTSAVRRRPLPAWGLACITFALTYSTSGVLLLEYNVSGGGEL